MDGTNLEIHELNRKRKEIDRQIKIHQHQIVRLQKEASDIVIQLSKIQKHDDSKLKNLMKMETFKPHLLSSKLKSDNSNKILEHISKEANTNIRMHNTLISSEEFSQKMQGRTYVPIGKVLDSMVGDDIDGDWATIGIVYHKSKVFTSSGGERIQCYHCTDLKKDSFRLFLIESQLENVSCGSVLAVLNCKIVKPSEQNGELALVLPSPRLCLKLGDSIDLGICPGYKEKCIRVVDKNLSELCPLHRQKMYDDSRLKRQEFASGTSKVHEGVPIDHTAKKVASRSHESYATYRIGSETVVAEGNSVKVLSPLKPTVQAADAKDIKRILQSNAPAAKPLRIMFGVEKEEKEVNVDVFSREQLKKLGGNPFVRDGICELMLDINHTPLKGTRSPASSTNGTPSKTNSKANTPSGTPSKLNPKKRLLLESDDEELELEILEPTSNENVGFQNIPSL